MRVLYQNDLNECNFKQPIVTIGTFDGLHLGHRFVLNQIAERAKKLGRESILITFSPHPKLVITGKSPLLIDTLEEKIEKLKETGIDTVLMLQFTRNLAEKSALEFSNDLFKQLLNCSEIWIGYDHQFGKNRTGNFEFLKNWGADVGIDVYQTQVIKSNDIEISSTKIRNALHLGDLETAVKMLGKPFTFSGIVVKGKQLGRTIGFPTANIVLSDENKLIPANGVYKVKVYHKLKNLNGIMNIGVKPTIDNTNIRSIEVHVFDFNEDIYGEFLKVELLHFIRGEKKFESLDQLKYQINEDISFANTL